MGRDKYKLVEMCSFCLEERERWLFYQPEQLQAKR